jgi:hypothetical protein
MRFLAFAPFGLPINTFKFVARMKVFCTSLEEWLPIVDHLSSLTSQCSVWIQLHPGVVVQIKVFCASTEEHNYWRRA